MTDKEYTPYQQRIIRNYYQNQQAIMLQRLQEIVGELYLAQGKARQQLWRRAAAAMEKLQVPQSRIQHLLQTDNPAYLANLVQELWKKL
ncbi:MAG: hypothetical protein NZ602_04775 [Thermoguttaceae bacterium]|nr:hypothetical protein [Thermoguttaceae bacterium]MDW8037327.1 hypothetical protein [Thermoguttaceae bacterium]